MIRIPRTAEALSREGTTGPAPRPTAPATDTAYTLLGVGALLPV